jgi:aminoglycoside phosphotransferase (APT) family kinase protein
MVAYIERVLPWAYPQHGPALAEAVKFLRREMYQSDHVALCWGDARLSNLLFSPDLHVAAVPDWETAFIGDHEADLAWTLFPDRAFSTHQGVARLPGSPERDEIIDAYQWASGWKVQNLRYKEVLAAAFLAIPLLRMAARFDMDDPTVLVTFCNARPEDVL